MFRKMLAAALLSVSLLPVYAASTNIDVSGLNDAQIAEIKAITAKKVAETAANSGAAAPEKITAGVALAATWGTQAATAAEGFAKAMGIAAKDLNLTINDFLKSPAGMLTAALIIWKMAGASILSAMYGVLFIVVGLTMVRMIYVRLFTREMVPVTYSRFFGMFTGQRMVRVPKNFGNLHTDGEWLAFWTMIISTVVIMAVGGTFF
jgi:hypothetical protein